MQDVARLAGVSIKTVSNVVNDYPHISKATRAEVEKAIVQLGYEPNLTAPNLRRGRTGLIGLALPDSSAPISRSAQARSSPRRRSVAYAS